MKTNTALLNISASPEMIGQRLDKALSLIPEIGSRSRASILIEENRILVNGKLVKSSYSVQANDIVQITMPEPEPSDLQPYDFPLDILFEDDDIIVVNKPAGLVVHPAAGHAQDTLVNALLHHTKNLSMKFGDNRPGIVHRLDKETSGVLVVAKNDKAHENLSQQFQERSIRRIYYAVAIGNPKNTEGVITSFLNRHPVDRKRQSSVLDENKKIISDIERTDVDGRFAITKYKVLSSKSGLSYMQMKLETGRTHQIRVHLSENGLPIAGDSTYGADKKVKNLAAKSTQLDIKGLTRFMLHAGELDFNHPRTNKRLEFKADWPSSEKDLIIKWGLINEDQ